MCDITLVYYRNGKVFGTVNFTDFEKARAQLKRDINDSSKYTQVILGKKLILKTYNVLEIFNLSLYEKW